MRSVVTVVVLILVTVWVGCGASTTGTHTVSHDRDSFTEVVNGRKVEYRNWTIKVGDTEIPIEKKKSVIDIRTEGSKIDIFVNGKQVHDE